jgi:hypothetical protein
LGNGYCTLFNFSYKRGNGSVAGHGIVIGVYNNVLHVIDPQIKFIGTDEMYEKRVGSIFGKDLLRVFVIFRQPTKKHTLRKTPIKKRTPPDEKLMSPLKRRRLTYSPLTLKRAPGSSSKMKETPPQPQLKTRSRSKTKLSPKLRPNVSSRSSETKKRKTRRRSTGRKNKLEDDRFYRYGARSSDFRSRSRSRDRNRSSSGRLPTSDVEKL